MAQLSHDCFSAEGPVRTVDEAVSLITSRLEPVEGVERVPLAQAIGRVLAKDLVAGMALPPFASSAVDGYAIRGEDLPVGAERAFELAGVLRAGAAADRPPAPGQAVRIFTGAPLPPGADTVFMQEDVRIAADGRAVLPAGQQRGANVRLQGEDIAAGAAVLPAGRRLRPQDIALAAALGLRDLEVRRRVRVAVFSNGEEIVEPGAGRSRSQLFDSNRFMLIAMLQRLGCEIDDLGILPDDPAAITSTLRQAAAGRDLVLTSGGVSVGEADFIRSCVEAVGALSFWRLQIKPGRPVAMGVVAGTPFVGLPGNPVAAFVTFLAVARPAILALAGAQPQRSLAVPVRAAFSHDKKIGRREYLRATLRAAPDGGWEAVAYPKQGSALLSSLVDTEGLVELAEDLSQVRLGQTVGFIAYESLL
jgi:molybdopterin molybdotransferase